MAAAEKCCREDSWPLATELPVGRAPWMCSRVSADSDRHGDEVQFQWNWCIRWAIVVRQ